MPVLLHTYFPNNVIDEINAQRIKFSYYPNYFNELRNFLVSNLSRESTQICVHYIRDRMELLQGQHLVLKSETSVINVQNISAVASNAMRN